MIDPHFLDFDWLNKIKEFFLQFNDEVIIFSAVILAIGIAQNIFYLLQVVWAAQQLFYEKTQKSSESNWWLVSSDITVPISIIIPAYNEEITITNTVISVLSTKYPSFEVLVINDGSKDKTLEVLISEFDLVRSERFYEKTLEHKEIRGIYTTKIYPNLVVIDKENGGRADALNAGITLSRHPLFCTIDADSLLDPSALLKAVQPFIDKPDTMVASGGTIQISNGCRVENGVVKKVVMPKKLLPMIQVVEYVRAFLVGRLAWSRTKMVMIIAGAFAVFKRDVVVEVGGFAHNTIGEDFELVVKIHEYLLRNKRKYDMEFVPSPVCWTEVPETLKVLAGQRIRWHQGCLETFFRYIKMFGNPRYGRIGFIGMPLIFFFDILEPILELIGYILIPIYYTIGVLNVNFVIAFLFLFFAFGIFISTLVLFLQEVSTKHFKSTTSLTRMAFLVLIENFGYRQLNNYWRLIGLWRFLRKKQSWGESKRIGVNK